MDFLKAVRERTLVLDGAMGTQLIERGYTSTQCPEEWNVTEHEVVADIHRAYFAAGSDIVHTNSFGGSRAKLAAYHRGDHVAEYNGAAARLAVAARDAAAPEKLVAGDIGPTGKFLKPMGELDPGELKDMFVEQAEAMAAGGVDLFSIETMFDMQEAVLAVQAVRAVSKLPVMASMTFKPTPKGYRTMMGIDPRRAAAELLAAGADVVGCNCSIEADEMVALVGEFRAATEAPLVAQPNAGQPRLEGGHTVYDETADHFAAAIPEIVAQGANIVGGCCGTGPAYIAALIAARGR